MLKWFFRKNRWEYLLPLLLFTLSSTLLASPIRTLSPQRFSEMAKHAENNKYPTLKGIKGLFHLKSNSLDYLPPQYKNHYDYCKLIHNYPYKLYIFNQYNYTPSSERSYLCFNLYQREKESYFLEFSVGDKITAANLKKLLTQIQKSFPSITSPLQVLCNTESIRDTVALFPQEVALTPTDLFKNSSLQILQIGTVSGTLKSENERCTQKDIVLIEKKFLTPPIGAAYIATKPITPLSHLAMLAHSQKAPLITVQNSDSIRKHMGKRICLSVEKNSYSLTPDTSKTTLHKTPNQLTKLTVKNTNKNIITIDRSSYDSRFIIGNKAANFAELQKLSSRMDFAVPEGAFAITFKAYEEHISKCDVETAIKEMVSDTSKLSLKLSLIRHRIKREPLAKELLDTIEKKLREVHYESFRFRSSSNAEDVKNFSGAGLYKSKSASQNNRKAIEKAVKTVWASLWSDRAFTERSRAGIDHETARMGVLVHRSFPSEKLNGVVITENLFDKGSFYGYTFNLQRGDISVVNSDTSHTAELSISYFDSHSDFFNRINSIDYITYSSLSSKPLLTIEEVKKTTLLLKEIEHYFYKKWNIKEYLMNFSIDVEFKIDKTDNKPNTLYIKQVRPY